ncbi:MAG: exonuclease SbcCD subunit D [Candidatus Hodarchaeota archaeon]
MILVADIHLGQQGFNRDDEKLKIISDLLEKDNVIILGDLFHTKNPSARLRKTFIESIYQKNNSITVIGGNHDMTNDGIHPLSSESLLPSNIILDGDSASKLHPGNKFLLHGFDVNNRLKTLLSHFEGSSNDNILFSHFLLSGSKLRMGYTLESSITINMLSKYFSLIFLGDVHQHQIIEKDDCKVIYIGSLLRNDFKAASSGYIELYDDLNWKYIPVKDHVYIQEINEGEATGSEKYPAGSFVRFDLGGSLGWYNDIKPKLESEYKKCNTFFSFMPTSSDSDRFDYEYTDYEKLLIDEAKKNNLMEVHQELVKEL